MEYFKYHKLVRDKIVDQMRANNQLPRGVRVLNDQEYIVELVRKVVEETEEMKMVSKAEDLKKELADVQEVLDCLKKVLKTNNKEIKQLQSIKKQKAGGFKKRVYIEDVGAEKDNEWYSYYKANPSKYPEVLK